MKIIGRLQKSNTHSIERSDNKVLRARLQTEQYEIDAWLGADNTYRIELTKHTPRGQQVITLGDGSLDEKFEQYPIQ